MKTMLLLKGSFHDLNSRVFVYVKDERSGLISMSNKFRKVDIEKFRVDAEKFHIDNNQLKGFIKNFDNTFDDLPVKDEYSDSLSEDVATYGSLFFGVLGILGDIID